MAEYPLKAGASYIAVPAILEDADSLPLKGLNLVFDTGASLTSLRSEFLLAAGYDPADAERTIKIVTGSSVESVPVVKVQSLSVLGLVVKDLEILALDLPPEMRFDGLLGLNFLNRFDTSILFSEGVLRIDEIE